MRILPLMLGACGQPTPALADFQATNALLAPGRALDMMLFIQDPVTEPVFYSAYATWAAALGCEMMCTLAPSMTLGSMGSGTYDTTGLNGNTGLHGLAAQCKTYGLPLIIRLAHEFNGSWNAYGNTNETAASYVAGWQHIVTYFRGQGVTNVSWCWCANIWGTPGVAANIVDPTAADSSHVNTPSTLFSANYASLAGLTGKPFGISEVGCAADPRLTALCGGKDGWYGLLFELIAGWPNVCFMTNWEAVVTPPATNQGDYTVNSSGTDPAALAAFTAGITAYPFAAQPGVPSLRPAGC
jgi:hypothetical protein